MFLALDTELSAGGRTFFENQWAGVLLFSPGQITPQCHSEQFCRYNHHGDSKIVEIALVAPEPTRKWHHTVQICSQPMEYMSYNFSNTCESYRFLLKIHVLLILNEDTGGKVFIFVHRLVLAMTIDQIPQLFHPLLSVTAQVGRPLNPTGQFTPSSNTFPVMLMAITVKTVKCFRQNVLFLRHVYNHVTR